uniref:UPF3 domain-containing protein n=1 Tax=Falco tinnunculus TaxID=100819 RepID=A0A8C4URA9_FALTI
MRSEREAGPGLMRGGGREKWPMDIPLRRESPRRDPDAPPNPPLAPPPSPPSLLLPPPPPPLQPVPGKQRDEKKTALSKVVIRRLPPCLTKEQLEEQLHPLPAHDYFEFCTADPRVLMATASCGEPCSLHGHLAAVLQSIRLTAYLFFDWPRITSPILNADTYLCTSVYGLTLYMFTHCRINSKLPEITS